VWTVAAEAAVEDAAGRGEVCFVLQEGGRWRYWRFLLWRFLFPAAETAAAEAAAEDAAGGGGVRFVLLLSTADTCAEASKKDKHDDDDECS
jgi:hypothetical protein